MRTITGIYKMIVYDTGVVELEAMPIDYLFNDLAIDNVQIASSKVSQKAYQIIRVLQEVRIDIVGLSLCDSNIFAVKQIVTNAIKKVASQLHITEQSVNDKITRQLGITKNDFVQLLLEFFKLGYDEDTFSESDLYKTIKESLSSEGYDIEYVATNFKSTIL